MKDKIAIIISFITIAINIGLFNGILDKIDDLIYWIQERRWKRMFKRNEKQSLLEARTKALKEAEKEIQELKEIRLQEVRNNTKILEQNNKKVELIKRITDLVNSNKYNNEKAVLNKIKELISDYQSQN